MKRLAEDRGFVVTVEKTVLDGHGHIDVALEREDLKIGCEISVTTRIDYEIGNLTKCLAAGFDYAVLMSSNRRTLDLARAGMVNVDDERVRFLVPDSFIGFLDEIAGPARSRTPSVNTEGERTSERAAQRPQHMKRRRESAPIVSEAHVETKRMLSAKDAAAYLGLATQTLAKLRCTGESPPFYKVGRHITYERPDLDAWLAVRRRRSTSDPGVGT